MNSPPTRRVHVMGATVALFLALVQWRLIALLFSIDATRDPFMGPVNVTREIIAGSPSTRIFQNRVLGPFIIESLSSILTSFLAAYIAFAVICLWIAGYLAWRLGDGIGGVPAALLSLVTFQLGFAFLLEPHWLYPWDFIDAIVFFLFIDFALNAKPWPWFAGLFAVAVFNRDIAMFIALWMLIDPVLGGRWREERAMVIAGLVCLLGGFLAIESLRWLRWSGESFLSSTDFMGTWLFHWRVSNLSDLGRALSLDKFELPLLLFFCPISIIAMAIKLIFLRPHQWRGLGIVHIALAAVTILFGVIIETRVWICFLPFLTAGTVTLAVGSSTVKYDRHR